jgi:hypothetical protein
MRRFTKKTTLSILASALLAVAGIGVTVVARTMAQDLEEPVRIGAICNDDWESSATGRGACSHHGGVMCWEYSDGTCKSTYDDPDDADDDDPDADDDDPDDADEFILY